MIKIIIWNYIIWLTMLALSMCFAIFEYYLNQSQISFFGLGWKSIASFLDNAKITINIIIYIVFLLVVIVRSSIQITLPNHILKKKIILVMLVPMTILSLFISIEIVLFGVDIFNLTFLQSIAVSFENSSIIYNIVYFSALVLLLHWWVTLWMISQIDINYDSYEAGE